MHGALPAARKGTAVPPAAAYFDLPIDSLRQLGAWAADCALCCAGGFWPASACAVPCSSASIAA